MVELMRYATVGFCFATDVKGDRLLFRHALRLAIVATIAEVIFGWKSSKGKIQKF